MTDTIKTIREAIESCVEANTAFTKLENKFNLAKNNNTNSTTRYGVIAMEGIPSTATILRFVTIDRDFEITLCNKFRSIPNKDEEQQAIGDTLENAMELLIEKLQTSKAGLPNLINSINFANNERIAYDEIENLAILRFNVTVQYRKLVKNC